MKLHVLCIVFLQILYGNCAAKEEPHLVYDEGFDWKAVFDAGFRPKRLTGLEFNRAYSDNKGFSFSFSRTQSPFRIGEGRTRFEVLQAGEVRIMSHLEKRLLSADEAFQRMKEFRELGGEHVWKDPIGDTPDDLPSEEKYRLLTSGDLIVKMNGNRIYYGCRGTGTGRLAATFMIGSSNSTNIVARELPGPIEPPEGYEGYDMSPDISKYELVEREMKRRIALEKEQDAGATGRVADADPTGVSDVPADRSGVPPWLIWLGIGCVLAISAAMFVRSRSGD